MKLFNRTILFQSITTVLLNISSAWFTLVLVTPVFTMPFVNPDNLWFLTKSIGFGMVYFAVGYWVQTRTEKA